MSVTNAAISGITSNSASQSQVAYTSEQQNLIEWAHSKRNPAEGATAQDKYLAALINHCMTNRGDGLHDNLNTLKTASESQDPELQKAYQQCLQDLGTQGVCPANLNLIMTELQKAVGGSSREPSGAQGSRIDQATLSSTHPASVANASVRTMTGLPGVPA